MLIDRENVDVAKRAATAAGDRLPHVGWWLTGAYLAFLLIMAISAGDKLFALDPNEFGDMLAGVFAPLAFLWLVLGFFQQGKELKASVAALELQGKELHNSVEQQRELVKVSREQMESEVAATQQNMRNFKDAERGNLTARISSGTRSENGLIRISCQVHNIGRDKVKIIEATGLWLDRIQKTESLPTHVMAPVWVKPEEYKHVSFVVGSDQERGDFEEIIGRITYQDQFKDRHYCWIAGRLTGLREPSEEDHLYGDTTTHNIQDMTDALIEETQA